MKTQVFLRLKKIAKRQKIKRFCFVMPYLMNMSLLAGFGNLGIACGCVINSDRLCTLMHNMRKKYFY